MLIFAVTLLFSARLLARRSWLDHRGGLALVALLGFGLTSNSLLSPGILFFGILVVIDSTHSRYPKVTANQRPVDKAIHTHAPRRGGAAHPAVSSVR
jgi:hypothetical protein